MIAEAMTIEVEAQAALIARAILVPGTIYVDQVWR
jgi:hypothetical protein